MCLVSDALVAQTQKFSIDSNSGVINLTRAIESTDDTFTLYITARDDGSCCGRVNQLQADTYIIVRVSPCQMSEYSRVVIWAEPSAFYP
jgi:hypothetical protein